VDWGSVEVRWFRGQGCVCYELGGRRCGVESVDGELEFRRLRLTFLVLSWDYDGGVLGSGGVVGVVLTLDVDSSVSGVDDFGFDIVIVASASRVLRASVAGHKGLRSFRACLLVFVRVPAGW